MSVSSTGSKPFENLSNNEMSLDLEQAAKNDDTKRFSELLKTITKEDIDESGALCIAARNLNFEMITALVNAGADVNLPEKKSFSKEFSPWTPLLLLTARDIKSSSIEKMNQIALFLIENGAESKSINGNTTPLSWAAEKGYDKIVDALIEKYPEDIDIQDSCENAALIGAIRGGHRNIVLKLLSKKASVKTTNQFERTPLHVAAYYPKSNSEIVEDLITHGAEIDALDNERQTPLMLLARKFYASDESKVVEQIKIAKVLLEKGADINAKDDRDNTAFDLAIFWLGTAFIRFLIKQNPDVMSHEESRDLRIFSIAKKGLTEVIKDLLEDGIDPNLQDKKGRTLLHIAIKKKRESLAKFLLSEKAIIKDSQKNTPFHLAAEVGLTKIIDDLIENGWDMNTQNKEGNTPLMIASKNDNNTSFASMLIDKGCGVDLKDQEGNTVLTRLIKDSEFYTRQKTLILKLLEKGAGQNIKNNEGKTAIDYLEKVRRNNSDRYGKLEKYFY